jgi:hypothetical protein
MTTDPDIAERIIEAVRQYAREHPGATWQTIAAELDATLDAESAAWFRAHPELTLAAIPQASR